ncbi:MAG: GAF domain-containing protein [Bacillota bacterium]
MGNTQTRNLILLKEKLTALIEDEENWLANLANSAALLYNELDNVNWAGYYLLDKKREVLTVGPFQGLPACSRIIVGNGVCGTSVLKKKTIVVDDVKEFPNHVVCDPASRSEIVVPIKYEGEIIGVLDVDSPRKGRFGIQEEEYLKEFVDILVKNTDFSSLVDRKRKK